MEEGLPCIRSDVPRVLKGGRPASEQKESREKAAKTHNSCPSSRKLNRRITTSRDEQKAARKKSANREALRRKIIGAGGGSK